MIYYTALTMPKKAGTAVIAVCSCIIVFLSLICSSLSSPPPSYPIVIFCVYFMHTEQLLANVSFSIFLPLPESALTTPKTETAVIAVCSCILSVLSLPLSFSFSHSLYLFLSFSLLSPSYPIVNYCTYLKRTQN